MVKKNKLSATVSADPDQSESETAVAGTKRCRAVRVEEPRFVDAMPDAEDAGGAGRMVDTASRATSRPRGAGKTRGPKGTVKGLADTAADLTADEVHAEADARVGAVMRAERLRRGWSLGALAEQAMISIGMLSQIERGLATPSLRTLRLLAGALDVPITQFFEGDSVPPSANPFIVRAGERHCLNLTATGINKMFLMPPGASLLEMWEFRFAPGGTSGGALYNHNGEKAGVVVKGRIKLLIGDDTYILEEGDSFRFSSMMRHRVDNDSDEEARVIWVVTPPASGTRAPSRQ